MDTTRRVGELDRKTQNIHGAVQRMIDGDSHLLVLDLGIVKDLRDVEYFATGNTRLIERGDPVVYRLRSRHPIDSFVYCVAMSESLGRRVKVVVAA